MVQANGKHELIFNYMRLTTDDYNCAAERHVLRPRARFLCILFDMASPEEGFRVYKFWAACPDCVQFLLHDPDTKGLVPGDLRKEEQE